METTDKILYDIFNLIKKNPKKYGILLKNINFNTDKKSGLRYHRVFNKVKNKDEK